MMQGSAFDRHLYDIFIATFLIRVDPLKMMPKPYSAAKKIANGQTPTDCVY